MMGNAFTRSEEEDALCAIGSMIERGEKAQAKFAPGTAPHTLQRNRLKALAIAAFLIRKELGENEAAAGFTKREMEQAHAPLASLASKSEKAREKLAPGSWQYAMLERNLKALHIAIPLLEAALD